MFERTSCRSVGMRNEVWHDWFSRYFRAKKCLRRVATRKFPEVVKPKSDNELVGIIRKECGHFMFLLSTRPFPSQLE